MWSESDISQREVDQDLTYLDWEDNVCLTETRPVDTEYEPEQLNRHINRHNSLICVNAVTAEQNKIVLTNKKFLQLIDYLLFRVVKYLL